MKMRLPLVRSLCLASFALLVFVLPLGADLIRIATYNVENYLVMDRSINGAWRPGYPKSEASKEALRSVIAAVSPDVLALQEMGPEPFFRELQRDLAADGLDYPHTYLLAGNDEERHVAVLSRLPFTEVHAHTDMTFPYFEGRERIKRGLLEVVFETGGERWSLFVLHLKSKWSEWPEDPQAQRKRTGEATAARNRILDRHDPESGSLYLIAGDFNDTRATAPLRRFLSRGSVQISQIIRAADSRGHTWTQHWERQGLYSRVDFLLASPALLERVVEGSGHIYDGQGYREASDHRMVWADFDLGTQATLPTDSGKPKGDRVADLLREVSR